MHMREPIRLNKHLAQVLGISRREADDKIAKKSVTVNDQIAVLGTIISPDQDHVVVDGVEIEKVQKQYTYILLNKPVGYICSRKKQGETETIYKLIPANYYPLKVAGRLDKDSCGLLLLTDDGDTIFQLTHPRFGKEKKYSVSIDRPLSVADQEKLNHGVVLDDGTSNLTVTQPSANELPNTYQVIMKEGRNRQIRRTFQALGYSVIHLERTHFGPYSLAQLQDRLYLQI